MSKDTSKVGKNRGQFEKGKSKTGGRTKGTPNKNTQELKEKIENEYPDYDPILSMVAIGNDPETPLELKVTCHKEVAKYIYPQRKAVEMTGDIPMPEIKIKGI